MHLCTPLRAFCHQKSLNKKDNGKKLHNLFRKIGNIQLYIYTFSMNCLKTYHFKLHLINWIGSESMKDFAENKYKNKTFSIDIFITLWTNSDSVSNVITRKKYIFSSSYEYFTRSLSLRYKCYAKNVLWNRAYMPKACHYYAHDSLLYPSRQLK